MSIRSLIELNHDYDAEKPEALAALGRYIRSGSREDAEELERFGLKVIGSRHHSGNYILAAEPDGFPVRILPRPAPAAPPSAPLGPVNCTYVLRAAGKSCPRTCERCGLGPCPFYTKEGYLKGEAQRAANQSGSAHVE